MRRKPVSQDEFRRVLNLRYMWSRRFNRSGVTCLLDLELIDSRVK